MVKRIPKVMIWLVLMALLLTACDVTRIDGSGTIITEARPVEGFDKIALSGLGRVVISQGNTESLTLETDDNLMQYIITEVRGSTLYLEFARGMNLIPSETITFRVGLIDLVSVNCAGGATFEIESLDTDSLDFTLSGGAQVQIDWLNATNLEIAVSGAADLFLAGQIDTQAIQFEGFGRYDAAELESREATVRISGAGDIRLWVHETLDVDINGAGSVSYFGSPTLSQSISGAGSVNALGEK
ncbi:MAG: head GIN domain-containing protein [Anaerolineales bacterium]